MEKLGWLENLQKCEAGPRFGSPPAKPATDAFLDAAIFDYGDNTGSSDAPKVSGVCENGNAEVADPVERIIGKAYGGLLKPASPMKTGMHI